ncbi:choice-of-anchor M domain-containing protein [Actinomyces sp. zg-332]|uniref:choice-of-anchor M domain-containing protein n=1 Tax=Actinomyces sp. zg-332 TaxID=2708340 RepID=UPI001424057D|nr:choice-of-anchor M domain-containing protein [Actinomyces sp. zg-332]QPK94044.1 choice-of-anchor M domain-containing protein [Actinomyces sp. zg-332]
MFAKQLSVTKKTLLILLATFLSIAGLTLVDNSKSSYASDIDLPASLNHICAGKKMIYRKHIDAAYINQTSPDNIDLKVVNGATVINASDVCIRLAPDANEKGEEVSRFAIPADRQLAFLGKPGEIVWSGPQKYYRGWPPLWAGIGALETDHETLPLGNIVKESIKMELVEADGPGTMEMFSYNGIQQPVTRIISSKDSRYKRYYMFAGMHTHSYTTFSKPGIYRLKWQGHATLKNGEKISTPIREVTWLVGSDAQVGLPEGTTTGINPITTSTEVYAEKIKAEVGDDTSAYDPEYSNDNYTPVLPEEWGPEDNPNLVHISKGHLDLKGRWSKGERSIRMTLKDESDPANVVERESESAAVEVPDSSLFLPKGNSPEYAALRELSDRKDKRLYELPEIQNPSLPWLGFNTEEIDYSNLEDGVTVTALKYEGPGRMIVGSYDALQNDFVKSIDTGYYAGTTFEKLYNPTHVHKATYFTQPGIYSVEYTFRMKEKGAKYYTYGTYTLHYLVGDKSINVSREKYNLPKLPNSDSNADDNAPKILAKDVLSIIKDKDSEYYTRGDGKEIKTVDTLNDLKKIITDEKYDGEVKAENIVGITDDGFYYRNETENKIHRIEKLPNYEVGKGTKNPAEVVGIVDNGYYYISEGKLYKYEGSEKPENKENMKYGQYWKLDENTNKYVRLTRAEIFGEDTNNSDSEPSKPADPSVPDNGSNPSNPVDPSAPDNGDSPSKPEDPANPDKQDGNDGSDNGNSDGKDSDNEGTPSPKPGNPDQPSKPAEPSKPSNPVVPSKPDNGNPSPAPGNNNPNNGSNGNNANNANNGISGTTKPAPVNPDSSRFKEISGEEYDRINSVDSRSPQSQSSPVLTQPFIGRSNPLAAAKPLELPKVNAKDADAKEKGENGGLKPLKSKKAKTTPAINNADSSDSSWLPLVASGLFGAGLMFMVTAVIFFLYTQKVKRRK